MKTAFSKSFLKDVKDIKDKLILKKISDIIINVESSDSLSQIQNIKRLVSQENILELELAISVLELNMKMIWYILLDALTEKIYIKNFLNNQHEK